MPTEEQNVIAIIRKTSTCSSLLLSLSLALTSSADTEQATPKKMKRKGVGCGSSVLRILSPAHSEYIDGHLAIGSARVRYHSLHYRRGQRTVVHRCCWCWFFAFRHTAAAANTQKFDSSSLAAILGARAQLLIERKWTKWSLGGV